LALHSQAACLQFLKAILPFGVLLLLALDSEWCVHATEMLGEEVLSVEFAAFDDGVSGLA
jgi:hypothetical protein